MHLLALTSLFCLLTVFSSGPALENPPSAKTKVLKPNTTKTEATNIIYQSKDGGQTWQDISQGLPEYEELEGFFAGESDLYLRVNEVMYRSKSNLNTPVWEKEKGLDPRISSIAFNRSGVIAYNYDGKIYQKTSSAAAWLPVYASFKKHTMRTIFETSDGTIFLGSDNGLFKSVDGGQRWKQVQNEGWVMEMVESEGVLVATGQGGIMRSTDLGEHWEWVISEGGVGIAAELIQGGFAVISYEAKTKSRRIRISLDNGKTWKAIDYGLPPSLSISSIKQLGKYLFCSHPDGIFRSSDMGKTWNRVHSSVDRNTINFGNIMKLDPLSDQRRVFKLFVSGQVLYAVARNSGC